MCQSRFLIEGLVKKGHWTVRQFGAAIKHENYDTIVVNEDFIIKPIDGFGNRDMILQTLASEKPDVILLFTDPRFFTWLYEISDEIREVCPLAYWHVWDNYPTPTFNFPLYEATDLINCHSHMTYTMLKEHFPEKTNFIPHSLPEDLFYPMSENERSEFRAKMIGQERHDDFVLFWVNRNARRKRPNDVLWSWAEFIKKNRKNGERVKATLLMHTDPLDQEGPNLLATAETLGIMDNVVFSTQRIDFEEVRVLHNISDACINISYAEGFGLATLEAMQCGNPIIAVKTGGLTRQVIDHRDDSENGIGLDVEFQSLVGSQGVPFIYEDYTSVDTITKAIQKLYDTPKSEIRKLGKKSRDYVLSEFKHQDTIDKWDESLLSLVEHWKNNKPKTWTFSEVES